jgi:hypothetical protein
VGSGASGVTLVAVLLLGRLVIWMAQTAGILRPFWNLHPILKEFGGCDLCLGFWVYAILAWATQVNIMEPYYMPGVSEVVTGIAFSFGMHLARVGWQTRFGTLELNPDP